MCSSIESSSFFLLHLSLTMKRVGRFLSFFPFRDFRQHYLLTGVMRIRGGPFSQANRGGRYPVFSRQFPSFLQGTRITEVVHSFFLGHGPSLLDASDVIGSLSFLL